MSDERRLTSLAIATTRPETAAFSKSSTTPASSPQTLPYPSPTMMFTPFHRGGSGRPLVGLILGVTAS